MCCSFATAVVFRPWSIRFDSTVLEEKGSVEAPRLSAAFLIPSNFEPGGPLDITLAALSLCADQRGMKAKGNDQGCKLVETVKGTKLWAGILWGRVRT